MDVLDAEEGASSFVILFISSVNFLVPSFNITAFLVTVFFLEPLDVAQVALTTILDTHSRPVGGELPSPDSS